MTRAVGSGETSTAEALARLKASVEAACELAGVVELWQITNKANEIRRILYPEHSNIFGIDDAPTPQRRKEFSYEASVRLITCLILGSVKVGEADVDRKNGAVALLDACPNPIDESNSPYVD